MVIKVVLELLKDVCVEYNLIYVKIEEKNFFFLVEGKLFLLFY